jgi:hypothetical protein
MPYLIGNFIAAHLLGCLGFAYKAFKDASGPGGLFLDLHLLDVEDLGEIILHGPLGLGKQLGLHRPVLLRGHVPEKQRYLGIEIPRMKAGH